MHEKQTKIKKKKARLEGLEVVEVEPARLALHPPPRHLMMFICLLLLVYCLCLLLLVDDNCSLLLIFYYSLSIVYYSISFISYLLKGVGLQVGLGSRVWGVGCKV